MRLSHVSATAILAVLGSGAAAQNITFTVMESDVMDAAARQIAAELAEAGGPQVTIAAFPWAVLRQNNTTDLISGTNQYHVMSGGYYLADVYAYFQPLDDLIARDNFAEGMIDGLMEPGRSEWSGGNQIGIPYGIDGYGMLVNSAMLDEAGVAAEFASWQDVIEACPAIEEATGAACISHPTGSPEQIGAFFFSGYAGPFINAAGGYELDAEAATAAAADIAALWQFLPEGGTAMSFDESHAAFRDGQAAILVTWPSFVTNMLDAEESPLAGNWELVDFPGEGFPWLSLWQIFVPAATEEREAAWTWIKAFAGPEHARRNLVEHNLNPVWLATYEDPDLAAGRTHYWPAMVRGFARAKNPPLSGEAQDFLTNTLQEVANGRMTPEAAIASVNAMWASVPVPAALMEAAQGSGLVAD